MGYFWATVMVAGGVFAMILCFEAYKKWG